MRSLAVALLLLPLPVCADGLRVDNALVPLAPPSAMAHAAYFSVTNPGEATRHLIGVTAEGYGISHIHRSEIVDDIATMSSVEVVVIAPGQTVAFEHGGLHVMLMKPPEPLAAGDTVDLTLEFANGEDMAVSAKVVPVGATNAYGS